jgi:AcrR family transcriptional regulator
VRLKRPVQAAVAAPAALRPIWTAGLWQSDRVQARTNGRGTTRAQATRAGLLSAARDVFAESGFADANIADVVARAGASVGSLYHHFGGKADLYLALFEDYQTRQEERAAAAVRAARSDGGMHDPVDLFLVGASAYLAGCWEERELSRLFLAGGGPPGFELIARRRYREWIHVNANLLRADQQPLGETLVLVLTTVVAEAGREVSVQDSYDDAMRLADEVL